MSGPAGGSAGAGAARSGSAAETEALGEALAPHLEAGDVVALSGPLGAGKTRFVAGLARGLGCRARVRSPSFTLVNELHGRLLLVHLDLYRLDPRATDSLGLEELAERGVLVAEWGEKLPAWLLEDALMISFEIAAPEERRLEASGRAGRGAVLREAWRALARGAPGRAP